MASAPAVMIGLTAAVDSVLRGKAAPGPAGRTASTSRFIRCVIFFYASRRGAGSAIEGDDMSGAGIPETSGTSDSFISLAKELRAAARNGDPVAVERDAKPR